MTGLEATMGTVHRLLRGEIDPAEASRLLGAPENRLAVYADFVRLHVRTALEKNYTALPVLFGRETWDALVDEYFRQTPPTHYELNAAAEGFRDFLADRARRGLHAVTGFHVALAELEWHEWVAYSSEEAIPSSAEVSVPTLNPTLTILDLEYPVAEWLRVFRAAVDDGAQWPDPPKPEGRRTVFVFRNPRTMGTVFREPDQGLLFAFKVAHDGMGLARSAADSGLSIEEVDGIMSRAADLGLVVLPVRP